MQGLMSDKQVNQQRTSLIRTIAFSVEVPCDQDLA